MKHLIIITLLSLLIGCSKEAIEIDKQLKDTTMAKTQTVPIGSPYAMVNSPIGTKSNVITHPDESWSFDTNDITITQVRNALGNPADIEGRAITDVAALCIHPNINSYALFRPTYESSERRLGDFAGYNPNAKPPVYFFDPKTTYSIILNAGLTTGNIGVALYKGERLPTSPNAWARVKLSVTHSNNTWWSAVGSVNSSDFMVPVTVASHDPFTLTGALIKAYYCDANGNVIEEVEGTHPATTISVTPYFYPWTIAGGNLCTTRHYYPYFDGVTKYPYVAADLYHANPTSPTRAYNVNGAPSTVADLDGRTSLAYGFSISYYGGVYYKYTLSIFSPRVLGSEFKDVSANKWYRVTSTPTGSTKDYVCNSVTTVAGWQ